MDYKPPGIYTEPKKKLSLGFHGNYFITFKVKYFKIQSIWCDYLLSLQNKCQNHENYQFHCLIGVQIDKGLISKNHQLVARVTILCSTATLHGVRTVQIWTHFRIELSSIFILRTVTESAGPLNSLSAMMDC